MQTILPFLKIFVAPSIILIGLCFTIRHFKFVRAISYLERLNSTEMMKVRAEVDGWLSSKASDEEKLNAIFSNPALHLHLILLTNLFTELGIAYKFGVINKKLTFEAWDPVLPRYWNQLQFYFQDSRIKGKLGKHFGNMAKDMMEQSDHPEERYI